ncbi:MAG: low molecular weight protein-tyrosine-phosphatase [Chitinophagaceae bacterium]
MATEYCSLLTAHYLCAMKILMVCLGNICRSPLAEGILQDKVKKAGLDWKIDSAGTNRYHTGEAPHRLSQKVARLHGIDISNQRARTITPEDFDRYDKIYALASDVIHDMKHVVGKKFNPAKVDLLMNEIFPGQDIDVPDPYYGGEEGYHEVYKMMNDACESIIGKYAKEEAVGNKP